jgi:hypothetical protein
MNSVKSSPQPSLFLSMLNFLMTSILASISSAIVLAGIVLLLSAVS